MKNNLRWAFKTFVLSMALSIVFSMVSQSLFPNMSVILSVFVIIAFVVIASICDMISVAVTSASEGSLKLFSDNKSHKTAVLMCQNTEKIASFFGDVICDICGILSGAGGVSLVLNLKIHDATVYFVVTCLISSLIAGLTIFAKAITKGYAVKYCDQIVLKTASFLEFFPRTLKKLRKKQKK